MSHQPYSDWMHLALEDALAAAQRAELNAHLAGCAACAAAWDGLLRVERLLAPAPVAAPRPGFTGRFTARLRQRRAHPPAIWGALTLSLGAVGAAALVLPAGVSLLWSLAQLAGQPATSAAFLESATAASGVARTLANALFITARGVGEWALLSPAVWALLLTALAATAAWFYLVRRLSLSGARQGLRL
ncbi:MAG: zf-HC2 domain-containing protein [Anaerolineales bacterium]|nr:zf-HC2 domain-containing protein [Anaerolineales bacterium]